MNAEKCDKENRGYTIVVADDHVLIRYGIKKIIGQDPSLTFIGEVESYEDLLLFLKKEVPDLLILDISMPHLVGVSHVGEVRKRCPKMKILILTLHKNIQYFYQSMASGADGYLLKDDSEEELLLAISKIRNGKTYISPTLSDDFTPEVIDQGLARRSEPYGGLTKREYEVLELVVAGCTSKDIAAALRISHRTVEQHRAKLLRKFNLRNSADLVNFAVRNGYVAPK